MKSRRLKSNYHDSADIVYCRATVFFREVNQNQSSITNDYYEITRLISLGLLSLEKYLACSLNYDDILSAFKNMKSRRLIL